MNINVIGRELLLSFILGRIPYFISFKYNDAMGITSYLRAIDTSNFTVYYFYLLALIQVLISHIGFFSPRYYERIKYHPTQFALY